MNNSDFISGAVALDLGKSGVKIAETLEIEVAGDWWNLVNSSGDTTTLKTFYKRSTTPPPSPEGVISLAYLKTDMHSIGAPSFTEEEPVNVIAWVGEDRIPYSLTCMFNGNTPTVAIMDNDGNLIRTVAGNTIAHDSIKAMWDYVNQRIIFASTYSSTFVWESAWGSNTMGAYSNPNTSFDFPYAIGSPVSFFECPANLYTPFLKSGVLYVKKTTPTVGMDKITVATSAMSVVGATTISLASSCRGRELGLFYSRKDESVGVAWVSSSDEFLYYVLESENWATLHLLSRETAEDGIKLTHVGTLVLPKTTTGGGEFFVAGLRNQLDGIIKRPSGFSFPTGMRILDVCAGDDLSFRVLGQVGLNLYMFSVLYSTMTISKMSQPYAFGYEPTLWGGVNNTWHLGLVKAYSSGDRELFFLQYTGIAPLYSLLNHYANIICYDKSSGNILWTWGDVDSDYLNGSYFPVTNPWSAYEEVRNQSLQRIGTNLIILQYAARYNGDYRPYVDYHNISLEAVILKDTANEFRGLLSNPKSDGAYGLVHSSLMHDIKSSVTWDETPSQYIFTNRSGQNEALISCVVSKTTGLFEGTTLLASTGGTTRWGSLSPSMYYPSSGYSNNFSQANQNTDALLRLSSYVEISAGSVISVIAFVDQVGTINSYITETLNVPFKIGVAVNKYGIAYFVGISENTFFLVGCNASGSYSRRSCTVPFTIIQFMVDEIGDSIIFVGAPVNGEIPCTKIKCLTADYEPSLAINTSDLTEVYTLSEGFTPIGGLRDVKMLGNYAFYQDTTGMTWNVQTEVSESEGVGGHGGEGTSAPDPVTYNYRTKKYIPYPFAREGIKVELTNISKTTKITLPETQADLIRGMLTDGVEFRGSRCVVRRIFPDHASNGKADIILIDGYIQDWSYSPDKKGILFTVSKTLIDVGASFPKRLMGMSCSHVFRGKRCSYFGADGICIKTKTDCVSKNNIAQFGAFPWVACRQRRVMWK